MKPRRKTLFETYKVLCRQLLDQLASAGPDFQELRESPPYRLINESQNANGPACVWSEEYGNLAHATTDFLTTNRVRDFEISVTASRTFEIWRMLLRERIEPQEQYNCSAQAAEISLVDNTQVPKGLGSLFLLRNLVAHSDCNGCAVLAKLGVNLPKLAEMLNTLTDSWEEPSYQSFLNRAKELGDKLNPGEPWGSDHLLLALLSGPDESRASLLLDKLGVDSDDVERVLLTFPRESQRVIWPEAAKWTFAYLPNQTLSANDLGSYEDQGSALIRALRPWIESPPTPLVATMVSSLFTLSAILHHHPSLTDSPDSRFNEVAVIVLEFIENGMAADPTIEALARKVIEIWKAQIQASYVEEWRPPWPIHSVTDCFQDISGAKTGLGLLKTMLSTPGCNAYKLLVHYGIKVEELAKALERVGHPPQESDIYQAYSRAHALASELTPSGARPQKTGTEHLLLALMEQDPEEPLPLLFRKLGVSSDKLKQLLEQLPKEK